ncbi:hypothetical protein ACQPZX_04575 [Actinoplanes sp. CA-142083]|uniref:hypothetical protein n=1 Tax=Actinoplanes sp. CA-142083 TaxID=3239903 RepID=UPI003D904C67
MRNGLVGIGDLPSGLWNYPGDLRTVLEMYVAAGGRWPADWYVHDADSLLSSDLTGDELARLWFALSGGDHRMTMDGREWIALVRATARSRGGDSTQADRFVWKGDDPEVIARVREQIGLFTRHPDHAFEGDETAVLALLGRLAGRHADLAFRLYLALCAQYYMVFSVVAYQAMVDLAWDLGRPEDLLDGLLRTDP